MAGFQTDVLPISGPSGYFRAWSQALVEDFAPTHVLGCAFLTKEKLSRMPVHEYRDINSTLIRRFEFASSLPSCIGAISIGSGSVVADPDHPYSELKAFEESVTAGLVTDTRGAVSLRAFSVSGPYVQRVQDYAFSNLLAQGLVASSPISISARGEVWRRYSDVEECLKVSMQVLEPGRYRLLESGGPLVEIRELARLIGEELHAAVNIRSALEEPPSIYASDNRSWESACNEANFTPSDLRAQIRKTIAGCKFSPVR